MAATDTPTVDPDMRDTVGEILDPIFQGVVLVGIVVTAFGAIKAVMANSNDDADGRQKGIMTAVSGAACGVVAGIAQGMINGTWTPGQ